MILKPCFLFYSSYQVILFLSSVRSHPKTDGNNDLDTTQHDLSELTFPPEYLLFSCRLSANMNRLSQHWKSKETMKHIRKEIHLMKSSRLATDALMEIVSEFVRTVEHETAQITILTLAETTSSILSRVTVRNFEYLHNYYKMLKKNPGLQKALLTTIQELVDIFRDPLGRRLLLTLLTNVQIKQISNQKVAKGRKTLLGKGGTEPEPERNIEPDGDGMEKIITEGKSETKIEEDSGLESLPTVTDVGHEDQTKRNVEDKTLESSKSDDLKVKKFKKPSSKQKGTDPSSVLSMSATVDDLSEHHSETDPAKETGKNVEEEKLVNESVQELSDLGTHGNDDAVVDKTEDIQGRAVNLTTDINLDDGEENESNVLLESFTIANTGEEENQPHGKKSSEIEPTTNGLDGRNFEPIDDEANQNIVEKNSDVHQVDNVKKMNKQATTKKNKASGESTADEIRDKVEQDDFLTESSDFNDPVTTQITDLDADQDTTSTNQRKSLSDRIADNESSTINYENEREAIPEDIISNGNDHIDHREEKIRLKDVPEPQGNAVMRNDGSIVQNLPQSELDRQDNTAIEKIEKQEAESEASSLVSDSDLGKSAAARENSDGKYISESNVSAVKEVSEEVVTGDKLMSELVSDKDSTAPAVTTDNENRDGVTVDGKPKKGRKSTQATPTKNEAINTSTHDSPSNELQIDVIKGKDSVKMEESIVEDALTNKIEDNASEVEIHEENQFQKSDVSTTSNIASNPDEDLQEKSNQEKYESSQSNNINEREVDTPADLTGKEIEMKSEVTTLDRKKKQITQPNEISDTFSEAKQTDVEDGLIKNQPAEAALDLSGDNHAVQTTQFQNEASPSSTVIITDQENVVKIDENIQSVTHNAPSASSSNVKINNEIAEVQNESVNETLQNVSIMITSDEETSTKKLKEDPKMKDNDEDIPNRSGPDEEKEKLDSEVFNTSISIDSADKLEEGEYSEHKVMQNSDTETVHILEDNEGTSRASAEMKSGVAVKENLDNVSDIPDNKNTQKISEQKNRKASKVPPTSTKSEETTKISDHDNILTNDNKDQSTAKVSQSFNSSAQKVNDDASKQKDGFSETKVGAEVHDDNKEAIISDEDNIPDPSSKVDTSANSIISAEKKTLQDKVTTSNHNDNAQKSIVEKEMEIDPEPSDEEEFDSESEYGLDEQINDEGTNLQLLDEDDEDDSGIEDDNDVQSVEEGTTDVESEEVEEMNFNVESMFSAEDVKLNESKDAAIDTTKLKRGAELDSKTSGESSKGRKEQKSEKVDSSRPTEDDASSSQPLSTSPIHSHNTKPKKELSNEASTKKSDMADVPSENTLTTASKDPSSGQAEGHIPEIKKDIQNDLALKEHDDIDDSDVKSSRQQLADSETIGVTKVASDEATETSTNDLAQTMVPEQSSVANEFSKTPSMTTSVEPNDELNREGKIDSPKLNSEFKNKGESETKKLENMHDSPADSTLSKKLKEDHLSAKNNENLALKGDIDETNIKAESEIIDQCITTTNFDHSIYKDDEQNVEELKFKKEEDGEKLDSSKKITNTEEVQLKENYESINEGNMETENSPLQPPAKELTSDDDVHETIKTAGGDKETARNSEETTRSAGLEDVHKTGTQVEGDTEAQNITYETAIGNGNIAKEEKDTTIHEDYDQASSDEMSIHEAQACGIAESGNTVKDNASPQRKRFSLKNYLNFWG